MNIYKAKHENRVCSYITWHRGKASRHERVAKLGSPVTGPVGADDFCRRYPTGGGRKAAAGINDLPADELDAFLANFSKQFPDQLSR